MGLEILKKSDYAESTITFVGLSMNMYNRPQYVLIDSDEGKDSRLKFPGLRFRAPLKGRTLEDVAADRFEEQTGLKVVHNLGLRAVIPARSRHDRKWIFRNIFAGVVDGTRAEKKDTRKTYIADAGHGINNDYGFAHLLDNSKNKIPIEWITPENHVIAELATNMLYHFDWNSHETSWMKRIPSIGVEPQTDSDSRELGCGLAVSSIFLVYRSNSHEEEKVILLKRREDEYPGYAGGKIETPKDAEATNIDPISCCVEEGAQEFGFGIMPLGLIGVACTSINMLSEKYHNSIVTYSFVARPVNPLGVELALRGKPPEEKMEKYVVEGLREHKDRVLRGELRMPDMIGIGNMFYKNNPGNRIPLTQIYDSGRK